MVPRRRGERRQVRGVGEIVAAGVEGQGAHVDRRRDQDHAVEADVHLPLEPRHEHRAADAAVALAEDVLGRVPAVVHGEEGADEVGDGVGVLVVAPEVGVLLVAERAAEAGADRVDLDEVGEAQQARRVVLEPVGRRARVLRVARDVDAPGADETEVQEDRGGARPAVEEERDRPVLLPLHTLRDVGDREEARRGLAVAVLEVDVLRRGGVGDVHPAGGEAVVGDELAGCGWRRRGLIPALVALGGVVGADGGGGRDEQGQKNGERCVAHAQDLPQG